MAEKIAVVAPEKGNTRKQPSPGSAQNTAGQASGGSAMAGIVQRIQMSPRLVSHVEVLTLQRTIGNRAVGQLLRRASEREGLPIQRSPRTGEYGVVVQRDPDDPDQSTDPSQSTDPNAGQSQSPDPSAGPAQSADPGAGASQSVDPNAGTNQSTDPNAGANQSTDPGTGSTQSTDPTPGPNQSADPTADPSQPTDPTGEPSRPTDAPSELDQRYSAAVAAGDWQTAAETLNGFNREDILSRLAGLAPDQIAKIHQGALDNPRVGPGSQVAQMTASAEAATPSAPSDDPQGAASMAWMDLFGGFPSPVPGTPGLPPGLPPGSPGPFPSIPGETPFNPGFGSSPTIGPGPGVAPPPSGGIPPVAAGGVAIAGFLLGVFGAPVIAWAIEHAAETSRQADPDDPNTSDHGVGGAPPQTAAGTDGDAGAPLQAPSNGTPAPAIDPNTGQPLSAPSNQEQAPATDPSTNDPAVLPGQPNDGPVQAAGAIPDEIPATLAEQVALDSAKSGEGRVAIETNDLGDLSRLNAVYGPGKWVKMEYSHVLPGVRGVEPGSREAGQGIGRIEIHWFKRLDDGKDVEFKFIRGESQNPDAPRRSLNR